MFLGLRVKTLANMGAYLPTFASSGPTALYATLASGPCRAQGHGQAMREGVIDDTGSGRLLAGSSMDDTMPRADDLPSFTVDHTVTACTHNPLGVKGGGEARAIGSPPAFINALTEAPGVRDIAMPATVEPVWRAANGLSA